jgi:hypothetical protein
MKSLIRISLSLVLACTMFNISAQSDPKPKNTIRVLSKDVQRYSNKSLSEPTGIQVRSVGTPAYVNSKMIRTSRTESRGSTKNITSSGTPAWVISKPVQLKKN